jgi:hypothetical protein
MVILADADGKDGMLVARANAAEAIVEGLDVKTIGSLAEAVGFLSERLDRDPELVDVREPMSSLQCSMTVLSGCLRGSLAPGFDVRDDELPHGGKTLERAQVTLMSPIENPLKMLGFSQRNPFF